MTTYPVFEVHRSVARNLEQLGTKRKFWFPRDGDPREWLFKAEERDTGEDWAEKIACELCEHLGIPHVHYELAIELPTMTPGVICANVATPPKRLELGNQLLSELNLSYPTDDEKKYGVRQHTVAAVADVIRKVERPPQAFCGNLPPKVETAVDVFAGYLMLDAFIANQDRHHQNWAIIREETAALAPTFDHGAALARNEPDEKRERRLRGPDRQYNVANFVKKARSSLYASDSDARTLGTLDAFVAFAKFCPTASEAWLGRLSLLNRSDIETIVSRVPRERKSMIAKEFTVQLLIENQKRLLKTETV